MYPCADQITVTQDIYEARGETGRYDYGFSGEMEWN